MEEEEYLNENKKKSTKKKRKIELMQQPIKVVYISNPMKVKATVAEFRSVVQGLTGRESDLPSSLSKYGAVAVDYYGAPDHLPPPEEQPCDGSACADLGGRELKLDDHQELPEFLSAPPVYYELQGHLQPHR